MLNVATTALGDYILQLCRGQNLSMREASIRAGLDQTTISQIVRRGKTIQPRPETLRLIAEALGGSYERMLTLAGYLQPPRIVTLNPEAEAKMRLITEKLADLPESSQVKIVDALALFVEVEETLTVKDAAKSKILPDAKGSE